MSEAFQDVPQDVAEEFQAPQAPESPHAAAFEAFAPDLEVRTIRGHVVDQAQKLRETTAAFRMFNQDSADRKAEVNTFTRGLFDAIRAYDETERLEPAIREAALNTQAAIRELMSTLANVERDLHIIGQTRHQRTEEKSELERVRENASATCADLRERLSPHLEVDKCLDDVGLALGLPRQVVSPVEPVADPEPWFTGEEEQAETDGLSPGKKYRGTLSTLEQDYESAHARMEQATSRLTEIEAELAQLGEQHIQKLEECGLLRIKQGEIVTRQQELSDKFTHLQNRRRDCLKVILGIVSQHGIGELAVAELPGGAADASPAATHRRPDAASIPHLAGYGQAEGQVALRLVANNAAGPDQTN